MRQALRMFGSIEIRIGSSKRTAASSPLRRLERSALRRPGERTLYQSKHTPADSSGCPWAPRCRSGGRSSGSRKECSSWFLLWRSAQTYPEPALAARIGAVARIIGWGGVSPEGSIRQLTRSNLRLHAGMSGERSVFSVARGGFSGCSSAAQGGSPSTRRFLCGFFAHID